jgi:hypothetical protein
MADTKISAEAAASTLDGTEVFPAVQGGANKKVTADQIKTFAAAQISALQAQIDALTPPSGYSYVISAIDTTPTAFSFTDVTGAAVSTVYESNEIVVSGINSPAPISITGGQYRIKPSGGSYGSYTSAAGTVSLGDTVQVKHTSSAAGVTAVNTVLTIGGVSDTYTTTTAGIVNLLAKSNAFNVSPWVSSAVDFAKNVVGPFGGSNTGWTVTDTTDDAEHRWYQAPGLGAGHTGSVYAKAGTASFISLRSSSCFMMVNLSSGTILSESGGALITAVGSGWYRLIIPNQAWDYMIMKMGTLESQIGISGTYAGSGTNTVLLAAAQVELGTAATAYADVP